MNIRRGQVWWWNCPEHNRAHIEQGTRPVIIVSNDTCNIHSPVVTVVPLTTSAKRPYPQQAPLVFNNSMSIALGDQITCVPVEEIDRFIGTLADFQMEQVDRAIGVQLGLIPLKDREVVDDGSC